MQSSMMMIAIKENRWQAWSPFLSLRFWSWWVWFVGKFLRFWRTHFFVLWPFVCFVDSTRMRSQQVPRSQSGEKQTIPQLQHTELLRLPLHPLPMESEMAKKKAALVPFSNLATRTTSSWMIRSMMMTKLLMLIQSLMLLRFSWLRAPHLSSATAGAAAKSPPLP